MIDSQRRRLMDLYPRIYFACHSRHVRDDLTGKDLSTHQASILDHLDDIEPTSLGTLADHMGVTPSTMSLAIDRLETGGWVSRERDPADRRRVQLKLTPAGVRIRRASSVLDADLVEALLRRLSPSQRQRALDGLALLADAAGGLLTERGG